MAKKYLNAQSRRRLESDIPKITSDMSAEESGEIYRRFLNTKPIPAANRSKRRRRKGDLEISEIFDNALNVPAAVSRGSKRRFIARLDLTIERRLAEAAKGDLNAAEMLIDMHAYSLKNGDFYVEERIEYRDSKTAKSWPRHR